MHAVMHRPMVAADGHSYEHDAIRRWLLSGHNTSPMTGETMHDAMLLPNHALKSLCAKARAENTQAQTCKLEPELQARLRARSAECSRVHVMGSSAWVRAMDGDTPEDVERMCGGGNARLPLARVGCAKSLQ